MDIQNIRAEVNYRKQNSNQQNEMFFSEEVLKQKNSSTSDHQKERRGNIKC